MSKKLKLKVQANLQALAKLEPQPKVVPSKGEKQTKVPKKK